MNGLINSPQGHMFIALLAAHLLADFTLQSHWMVANKRRPLVLALHILIVTATAAVAIGWLDWRLLAILAITHAAMDAVKMWLLRTGIAAFAIDQGFHLLVLAGLASAFPDGLERGLWGLLPPDLFKALLIGFTGIGAAIASVSTGGIVIGLLLAHIKTPAIVTIGGLKQGGRYIGWLERGLTLLFVAIGQPEGVGLLLAAKSILRFGDISNTRQRARAEYIIIGTFMNFGWALAVASAARAVALCLQG